MIAPRGRRPRRRRRAARSISGTRGGDLGVVEQHADHAGRGHHHLALAAVEPLGDGRGDPAGGVGARPAGEGVGAAGVDHQGPDALARRSASSWRLHQSTGAEPTPWRVKTPAQVVALGEAHQQQVVALVLVEAGAADRELDAGDRRDRRKRHGEGRDRDRACRRWGGVSLALVELAG